MQQPWRHICDLSLVYFVSTRWMLRQLRTPPCLPALNKLAGGLFACSYFTRTKSLQVVAGVLCRWFHCTGCHHYAHAFSCEEEEKKGDNRDGLPWTWTLTCGSLRLSSISCFCRCSTDRQADADRQTDARWPDKKMSLRKVKWSSAAQFAVNSWLLLIKF